MPLDRSYTDVEKEIVRRLSSKPDLAGLYNTVRKFENSQSLLHAVAEFVMHEYQCASGKNIAQPYEGMLTISDIRCMRQDFEEGLNMSQQMAERILLFRLVEVYERQIETFKPKTLCFKLNTCAMNETSSSPFSKVESQFEEIFDFEETEDIFTKKYLLFPNYYERYGYVTLVINPGAAIKKKNKKKSRNNSKECVMVHIGNRDFMMRYMERVVPRIEKLLELFLGLHAEEKGYLELDKSRITNLLRYTDTLHRNDRPYQMIHLMEKMLETHHPLSDFDNILNEIKRNPRTAFQIDAIRFQMLSSIEMAIKEGDDEPRKHLLGKAQRAGEFYRQRRAQLEKEEAIAAGVPQTDSEGRPLSKRFKPNEVFTIED
ncbi:hypothetical protein CRE_05938 [Caenorhabditis remanei]|uniref:Uncharacterized protein n=1 Tax=Caenorhabditis remanei TaxID=31234 RepID=E3MZE0_CAERE|nr:hypothetical protein CRE_05938 [Caenorhabditis remanei]